MKKIILSSILASTLALAQNQTQPNPTQLNAVNPTTSNNNQSLTLPSKPNLTDNRSELTKKLNNLPLFKNNNKVILLSQEHPIGGGIYQARTAQSDFFIFKNNPSIFFTGTNHIKNYNLKEESLDSLYIKQDLNFLKEKALLTLGSGEKELILVANPECPTSKKLQIKLSLYPKFLEDHKIFVLLIPYPANELGIPNGVNYIKNIINAPTLHQKQQILTDLAFGDNLRKYTVLSKGTVAPYELHNLLEEQKNISTLLGANATPTLLEMDAKPLEVNQFIYKLEKKYLSTLKPEL